MKDIAKKTDKQLQEDLQNKKSELRDMKLGIKAAPHSHSQRVIRKDIARIMTELSSRQKVA